MIGTKAGELAGDVVGDSEGNVDGLAVGTIDPLHVPQLILQCVCL